MLASNRELYHNTTPLQHAQNPDTGTAKGPESVIRKLLSITFEQPSQSNTHGRPI